MNEPAGHGLQIPPLTYVPHSHGVTDGAAVGSAAGLALHSQAAMREYVLCGQAAQAVAETAPVPGLYVPAEQGAQELDFESK